jgi:hypothetical protein
MTPCASLRVQLAVEPHTDQSASLTVRTHQARLGGSTRSSSCASNPNVAHASLRGKQMPAKMTYSGVALSERGPSFRNPTPTMRKNSCNEPPRKEAADPRCDAQVLPLAPVPIKTTPSAYSPTDAMRPIHQSISRLFVMGGHGELKLLAQAMRELPNSELLDFRPLANGSQVWDVSFGQGAAPGARLPLRSSCEPFGVPLIHTYHSSVNSPGTIY